MECLRRVIVEVPDIYVGAGTVIQIGQVDAIKSAGANFGVAPGYHSNIARRARELHVPFVPGIATPSEIEGAVGDGCGILKFFHAEGMGGVEHLKGINGPYSFMDLKHISLGGLNTDTMRDYLEHDHVPARGGSWIASRPLIRSEDRDGIARNADEAARNGRTARQRTPDERVIPRLVTGDRVH